MKQQRTTAVFESLESRRLMSASATLIHSENEREHSSEHEHAPKLPPPVAATGLAATVSGTQVQLSWTDNSDNELGFVVYRRSGKSHDFKIVGATPANVTTFNDNTATDANDVYIVRAYNSTHTSPVSNTVTVNVPALVTVIAPKKLKSKALSTTSIQVSFDGDYGATGGYTIQRSTDNSTWTTAGSTGTGVKTFTDTRLTLGTKYYYRIVAIGPVGQTATSAVLIGMTKLRDQAEHPEHPASHS